MSKIWTKLNKNKKGYFVQRFGISDVATLGSNMGEHLALAKREPDMPCYRM